MSEADYVISLNRRLAAGTTCERKDLLVADDDGHFVVSTTANRGTKRTEAIALSGYTGTGIGRVHIQSAGTITPELSGLGAGDESWVRASSTGRPERVATPSGSDDIIGRCEADGRLHLMFGVLNATLANGTSATGTGFLRVTGGVLDAAASAVNLAGGSTHVTGALPVTNLATGSANTVLTMAGATPTWAAIVNANVSASAAIAVSKLAAGSSGQVLQTNGSGIVLWGAAPATAPGGSDKQLQWNDAASFAGEREWTRESVGRINIAWKVMTGIPEVIFATGGSDTLTRNAGSWITDGFAVGDTLTVLNTVSNNGTLTVTNVDTTVLTVAEAVTNETVAGGATAALIFAGGYITMGLAGGSLPSRGMIRIPTQPVSAGNMIDQVLLAGRTTGGVTLDLIAYANNELMFGGTWDQAQKAAGITDRLDSIAFWATNLHLDSTVFNWRNEAGTLYYTWGRATVQTTDDTPTALMSCAQDDGAINRVTIKASGPGGTNVKVWEARDGVVVYERGTAGASTWAYDPATGNVTGQAATTITWRAISRKT